MDKSGSYRPNHQLAKHADKMNQGRPNSDVTPAVQPEDTECTKLHDHGDGTYTSECGGESMDHTHIGHALMHIASHHEPDGIHHHVHSDGMSITDHHVRDGAEVEGPHEHGSPEEAGEHLASVLSGGDGEYEHPTESNYEGKSSGMHSLTGV
jgi:hypothetical protein